MPYRIHARGRTLRNMNPEDGHEERERVRDDSDTLLAAVDKMKRIEVQKRGEDISSPPFHRLAEDVEAQARHVFDIAANETRDGDRAPSSDVAIDEVPPGRGEVAEPTR